MKLTEQEKHIVLRALDAFISSEFEYIGHRDPMTDELSHDAETIAEGEADIKLANKIILKIRSGKRDRAKPDKIKRDL